MTTHDLKTLPVITGGITDATILFGSDTGQSALAPDPIQITAVRDYITDYLFSTVIRREVLLADRTYFVRTDPVEVTISIDSPGLISWLGHGLQTDDPVVLRTTGLLPTPLERGVVYYAIVLTADTLNLAATPGGPAIDTSGAQSGTHEAQTGNDENDGLSAGRSGAWLTIQHAAIQIATRIDLAIYDVYVDVAFGVYREDPIFLPGIIGTPPLGYVTIEGNPEFILEAEDGECQIVTTYVDNFYGTFNTSGPSSSWYVNGFALYPTDDYATFFYADVNSRLLAGPHWRFGRTTLAVAEAYNGSFVHLGKFQAFNIHTMAMGALAWCQDSSTIIFQGGFTAHEDFTWTYYAGIVTFHLGQVDMNSDILNATVSGKKFFVSDLSEIRYSRSSSPASDVNGIPGDIGGEILPSGYYGGLAGPIQVYDFADLPAGLTSPMYGLEAVVTDSSVNIWGDTVVGGGSFRVLAWHNGTTWTVIGK